ncbi:MFS transporter [Niveispirillum irakense]|uniref:MFS transporter n=1 Tax=Niveispirillum irakense TaxID=34011 RepID=UPI0004241CCF|nr:MFS transporter [Niveispirillum irakense]
MNSETRVDGAAGARRPFYGWVVVLVSLLGISTGPAAFGLASLGLMIGPLEQEFGWDRAQTSSAVSIMMICTALSLPFVGRLVDRFGVRRVLIPSIIIMGLCLLSLPLVTALWQFVAVYIVMGTLAVGSNSVPYMRVLASWFDRSRGLAIGIAGSGTGLGFAYVPVLTEWLVTSHGWRTGYVGLGLIMLCLTLPMILFLLRESPAAMGLTPDGLPPALDAAGTPVTPAAQTGDTLREALTRRDFWSLVTIFVSLAFVLYGLIPHLVPMLTDRGLSTRDAAQIASIFGLATFGGRLLIGFLIDRHDARLIAFIFFSLSALGLGVLAMDLPTWAFLVAALLLGGSLGAEVDMLAYLTSRYFGLRSFAAIFGVLFGAVMMGMGLGPAIFGFVFDKTGSYNSMLALGVPICLMAIVLVTLLRPYAEKRRGAPLSVT